jgi:membrane protease YdiL (CAAX protease family)
MPNGNEAGAVAPLAIRQATRIGLIALAALLTFSLPWLADSAASALAPTGGRLTHLFIHHGLQALMALIVIGLWPYRRTTEFGLRWPDKRSDVWAVCGWCLALAVVVIVLSYAPNLLGYAPPANDHPLTATSFAGWTLFEGFYVGPTEEVLFRSLLIGILSNAGLGVLRIGRIELSGATIVAALLFGMAHYAGVTASPWWANAYQIVYAILLGLIYGYWFERSRSMVGPAVAHNAVDLLATWVAFGVSAFFR